MPKLNERNSSFKTLHVDNGSEKIVKTQEVANMDSVMKSEFQKRFGGIMMESLLSTIANKVMQKQLRESIEDAGGSIGVS